MFSEDPNGDPYRSLASIGRRATSFGLGRRAAEETVTDWSGPRPADATSFAKGGANARRSLGIDL